MGVRRVPHTIAFGSMWGLILLAVFDGGRGGCAFAHPLQSGWGALRTPHHRLRLDVGLGIVGRLRRRLWADARVVSQLRCS